MIPAKIIEKYKGKSVPTIGVSTVRDFCDSWDNMRPLASICGDLKDVQRPWMIKAILASVPTGSRLCEIGAGEPFVADFLSKCGYEVTIVDPYDGSGQGPTGFDTFSASYPDIRFVRENFSRELPAFSDGYFDAIYSISVLEHVPRNEVLSVCRGIKRYCKLGGVSIHAIDHVLRGNGDTYHHDHLLLYADSLGIPRGSLEQILKHCEIDVETYFLSAEGHNLWRGAMSYESFPMRKVISVNLLSRVR
jgi:ubiquinone/menaquinone biosynthesis C-methylase UbiE